MFKSLQVAVYKSALLFICKSQFTSYIALGSCNKWFVGSTA